MDTVRIFGFYKKRLTGEVLNARNDNSLRFNVIDYLCSFPGIDPYLMAAELKRDGVNILFDDSSISEKENKAKKRKVESLL